MTLKEPSATSEFKAPQFKARPAPKPTQPKEAVKSEPRNLEFKEFNLSQPK
jgi:hypothetical protein